MKIVALNALARKCLSTLVAGLLSVGIVGAATPAHALLFEWSFVSVSPFDNPGETVSGTIGGLEEGSNSCTGGQVCTVVVTSTPTGDFSTLDWAFFDTDEGGDAFTVLAGDVTFADAFFTAANPFAANLFFGVSSAPSYFPELVSSQADWGTVNGSTIFTAIPEPASALLFGVGLIGLVGIGRRRRNRHQLSGQMAA